MSLFHLALIAIIQGLTEFLPVSSSGHLILLPNLTQLDDQGLLIDVAAHVGTLFAVVLYFWKDVVIAARGSISLVQGRLDAPGAFLALCLVVATVPVVLFGLALKLMGATDLLRSTAVIGWTMLVFGLVLYWADQTGAESRRAEEWTLKHAVILGLWQAVALIPGTSRSGITITGARFLGYSRTEGAKLSMLMSIPTIAMAGLLLATDVVVWGDPGVLRDAAVTAVLAFGAALLALVLMFRLMRTVSFTPYVIYRVILGAVLLVVAYS